MLFLLATPEYNKIQSNTTKVKVHLRNGIAEILDQHQDLMGRVENNLVEIETNFENKIEKSVYILQDAVFIVSNKGLDNSVDQKGTGVYIYARRVQEINSSSSIEEFSKRYETKSSLLENELQKLEGNNNLKLNSKLLLLKDEVEFLKRSITILKTTRS